MKFITNKAITAKYKLSKFYAIGVIIFIVIFSGLTFLSVFLSFVKL